MESIETLNARLIDYFGVDISSGDAMFRIVWANGQTEKRLVSFSDEGVAYLYPVVLEVKKYPYLRDIYVLERLVAVPEVNEGELPAYKVSYEPIWSYQTDAGVPIPPVWEPTKFIVDTLYAALGKKSMAKYVEPEGETTPEGKEQRIMKLQDELFGNETDAGDALAHGHGVTVPTTYEKTRES